MSFASYTLVSVGLLSLAGCMASNEHPLMNQVSASDGCPVSKSGDWKAWLEPNAAAGQLPVLNISGKVDLPTPGYTIMLIPGPADRAMPPSQRFALKAMTPSGIVAQVITPTPVAYREIATYPAYRSVVIQCGERVLATIKDIPMQR